MASSAESWRKRIEQTLETLPRRADATSALLANVIGPRSAELNDLLASPSREAAVLVGLRLRAGQIHILLTERAAHLADHPGQVSFPGGRLGERESAIEAALREASEEVALPPAEVDVLGLMPPRLTGTGFAVTPVVGWLPVAFEARPDPAEVRMAFDVPVAHLLDPANARETTRSRFGTVFRVYEFRYGRHRIWGATAAILAEFLEVIDAKTIR